MSDESPAPRRVVDLRHPGKPAAAKAPKAPAAPSPAPAGNESIAAHSRMLVEAIVGTFTDRLKSEVAKYGQLTELDIDRITDDLNDKRVQLEAVFRKTLETYVQARERAAFDNARQFPFDRLIVNTFAELFTPKRAEADGEDKVTRKVLPGFFMAIDRMLPPERLAEYQERCRAIVSRIAGNDDSAFEWQKLYADAEANVLLIDALAALAPYFEAVEKRRNWFLPLVNDNLQKDAGDTWELSPRGFLNLMLAMFTPLRNELRDMAGRGRLFDRYGPADLQNLQRIIDKIWGPSPNL